MTRKHKFQHENKMSLSLLALRRCELSTGSDPLSKIIKGAFRLNGSSDLTVAMVAKNQIGISTIDTLCIFYTAKGSSLMMM